jgi:uncharacterized protein (TIGR02996 family)
MSVQQDLYQAVLDAPDRDGPRRRYAAYLEQQGDELGEFIRLALDWDRKRLVGAADTRALVLYNRLRGRLAAPLDPWIRSYQLDRGLVAEVDMDGKTFVDHGSDVFARAPIQHLNLVAAKPVFAEIVQSPVLARVQTIGLSKNDLTDHEIELLAASPHVRGLLYLGLFKNQIGQVGLEAIAASPNLAALKVLSFDYNLVESPVSKWSNDGVSGQTHYEGAGAMQAFLKTKYGPKAWMEPEENVHRFRMCDAGE